MKKENEKIENTASPSSPSSLSLYQGNFMLDLSKELKAQMEMSPFLPYFFLSTKKSRDLEPWKLFYVEDEEIVEVSSPFTLISLSARPTLRKLDGEKYSLRYFAPNTEDHANKTRKEWFANLEKAQKNEEGWQIGLTHLICCLSEDGDIIGTYESFGKVEIGTLRIGINPFFSEILLENTFQGGKAITFQINDFEKYVRTSKATGFSYLASYALQEDEGETWFLQTQKIFEDSAKRVQELLSQKKDSIDGFMNR